MAKLFNLQVIHTTLVGGAMSPIYSDPALNATLATADRLCVHIIVDGTSATDTEVTVDIERSNDGLTWESSNAPKVVEVATPGGGPESAFNEWELPAAFNRVVAFADKDNALVRVIVCGRSAG